MALAHALSALPAFAAPLERSRIAVAAAHLTARRMKQRQEFGRAATDILVRLSSGFSFGLPGAPFIRNGLVGTGFIFVPDRNAGPLG
jgi:hypothetical protein